MENNILFARRTLTDLYIEVVSKAMAQAMTLGRELFVSRTDDEILDGIMFKHVFIPVILKKDKIYQDKPEEIMIARVPSSSAYHTKVGGVRFRINLPFSGDHTLFDLIPSKPAEGTVFGRVDEKKQILSFVFEYQNGADLSDMRQVFDDNLMRIESRLSNLQADLKQLNTAIREKVSLVVQERRKAIEMHDTGVADIGFPVR